MTERGESHKIIVLKVPDRTANTLVDLIEEWIEDGTYIMSDEWPAYGGLEAINAQRRHGYIWQRVNHKVHFVRPSTIVPGQQVHTQTIEARWRDLKNSLKYLSGGTNYRLCDTYLYNYMFRRYHKNEKIWQNILYWVATMADLPH